MRAVLDFFTLREALPLILLIVLLRHIGAQIVQHGARPRAWAKGVAIASFVLFSLVAAADAEPKTPLDVLVLCLRALLAMGTANGFALVGLPVASFLYHHLVAEPRARRRAAEAERAKTAEAAEREQRLAAEGQANRERAEAAKRRQAEEAARRPLPPTREERIAAAKKRHDDLLAALAAAGLDAAELNAARERAKQQYLHDLDGAMR